MGFLCINKNGLTVVSQEVVQETTFLQRAGLDNVNLLNPEIDVCTEVFHSPEYYVDGVIGLVSGMTSTLTGCTTGTTGIYNLTYTPNFDVTFNITGGTDYTGYTGSFCYKVFSDNRWVVTAPISGFRNGSEIIDSCTPFSAVTCPLPPCTDYVTQQFLEGGLPITWAEYLIRPYYKFTTKNCSNVSFSTWDGEVQLNAYQPDRDYYFMTIVDPPTPVLNPPGGTSHPNYTLVTDNLLVNGVSSPRGPQSINGVLNYFILGSVPSDGRIMLFLNGVRLSQDFDFTLIKQGFNVPPLVKINEEIVPTDVLIATYVTGLPTSWSGDFGAYFIDTILVDSIVTDPTPAYRVGGDNTLAYNSITGKYEFYTSLPIDDTFAITLSVNGVTQVENIQYFISTSFDGRIIFNDENMVVRIGDVISVLAVSQDRGPDFNNYGTLTVNEFLAQWSVPSQFTNSKVTGRFIVQAFNDDTNLLMNQNIVPFVSGQSNYESLFTNLSIGINYIFRVTFESTYVGYLNNSIITCSFAEGYFDTNNDYIKNTY
jgi:hypothetical protein